MRILHISTRLILGGSQENTVLSCEGQARRGHEVHLAFGPIYGPEGSLLERVERFNTRARAGEVERLNGTAVGPISTHTIPNLIREVHPQRDRAALGELRELIGSLRPDIVHTHSSKAGILGRFAAWSVVRHPGAHRVGIVHTIHGPPFMPIDGNALGRLRRRVNNAIYTLAERAAARRCHRIVSVADAMTSQYLARGIGTPPLYTTVRSGMEVDTFLRPGPREDRAAMRASLGLRDSDFVLGTVARLAEHKGHDDILDALADDLRRDRRWKLLWVGDGWWRDRLVTRARALGLTVADLDGLEPGDEPPTPPKNLPAAQLILTGLVPPERVAAHIRAMDVLIHPSYREGLPRTVPQALLCGVCPVAYDADGTREACRDNETGLLVPVGDRPKLAAAVRRLAADPALRSRLAGTGRDWATREFSADTMVESLDLVYQQALAEAHTRSRT